MSEPDREGIVVLGCPRSGTTLLRRLLDNHPSIAAPGETYLLTAAARFIEGEAMVDGLEVGVLNGLGFLGFDEDDVIEQLREFIFSFRRRHAQSEGKPRWLEKSAIDAFHVDAIQRICGRHVHYLCVVRHGLDVAASMEDWIAKTERFPAEIHRYVQAEPRPAVAYAKAWADATTRIADFAEANQGDAILVRYEDIVENTDAEIGRILNFVGETFAATGHDLACGAPKGFSDWRSFSRTAIDDASVGRWKSALSRGAASELADIVNPVLRRFGYDQVDAIPALSNDQLRRRYEIGLRLQEGRSE